MMGQRVRPVGQSIVHCLLDTELQSNGAVPMPSLLWPCGQLSPTGGAAKECGDSFIREATGFLYSSSVRLDNDLLQDAFYKDRSQPCG